MMESKDLNQVAITGTINQIVKRGASPHLWQDYPHLILEYPYGEKQKTGWPLAYLEIRIDDEQIKQLTDDAKITVTGRLHGPGQTGNILIADAIQLHKTHARPTDQPAQWEVLDNQDNLLGYIKSTGLSYSTYLKDDRIFGSPKGYLSFPRSPPTVRPLRGIT